MQTEDSIINVLDTVYIYSNGTQYRVLDLDRQHCLYDGILSLDHSIITREHASSASDPSLRRKRQQRSRSDDSSLGNNCAFLPLRREQVIRTARCYKVPRLGRLLDRLLNRTSHPPFELPNRELTIYSSSESVASFSTPSPSTTASASMNSSSPRNKSSRLLSSTSLLFHST